MSVKNFKFVSPGVFINEIDNSFIPKSADAIGPVVIGRATKGLAMQPVKVESYSDFVTMFGDAVPGNAGGDVYREGNRQSPMYGTYAAKAFLRSNVAPLTYVRLLGHQAPGNDGSAGGQAGWKTTNNINNALASNGGAYGLFVFPSSSTIYPEHVGLTGTLAAIWYLDNGYIRLSGTFFDGQGSKAIDGATPVTTASAGCLVTTNTTTGLFKVVIGDSSESEEIIEFDFDDSKETFIRKRFNTNPQLGNANASDFYAAASEKNYWLGETFEQELRDGGGASLGDLTLRDDLVGIIYGIALSGTVGTTPGQMKDQETREATAGWFIGQHLGTPADYNPELQQKLFRLLGRGHGEWLHKNLKVSITQVKQSTTTATDYGTFSVVLRMLRDTDNNVIVMERFDNLTLDPTSPDYVARRIGDQYYKWDSVQRRLKLYGDYPNLSKYVRVDMNVDADAGATDPVLLPFGYFGPPKIRNISTLKGAGGATAGKFIITGKGIYDGSEQQVLGSGAYGLGGAQGPKPRHYNNVTASIFFPSVRLRNSASDGGLSDTTNAFFGLQTTRMSSSTRSDLSVADPHRLLYAGFPDDPTSGAPNTGVQGYSYVFSLDDIVSGSKGYYYESGSRVGRVNGVNGVNPRSATTGSYTDLLEAGYDRYTAPFWGGFDGLDITKPDPMYNKGMSAASTENNSYIYNTYRRAVDTVADPEFVNMNTLVAPGLTHDSLTTHMINVCEERGDAMALIDLANVYIPSHEQYKSTKSKRIGTTPTNVVSALRDRRIDSSYGATFYPWVQTRDDTTGQLVWIPPTVAMLGVLASSERQSQLWFAPAGFNRGGLSDGAAGIPIVNVTERLTSKERDTLYEARINPIASFPSTGIVVFGQKTLQERRSALDRINVRRLVIYLKKQISILSSQLLFEQNVQATWDRFTGLISPLLANVKVGAGITDYRLILDESTTTPDLIDQNILYAKILIKPARAIEYIAIDFVIMSTGASFDD
jgi:hypothetical protein